MKFWRAKKMKPVLDLRNVSGNAFAILGAAQRRMKELNVPEDKRKAFLMDAMSGDYHHLMTRLMEEFNLDVRNDFDDEEEDN